MKKFIIIASFMVLVAPVASFAQGGTTTSCAVPANPTSATDLLAVITCLQGRMSALENRVSVLESEIASQTSVGTVGGTAIQGQPSTPTNYAIPATQVNSLPATQVNGGGTNQVMSTNPATSAGPTGIMPAYPGTPTQIGGGPTLPPVSTAMPTTGTCNAITNVCVVQEGATNPGIEAVQAFLQSEGIFKTAPTGYFGPITKGAIQQFQAVQGLPQTGVVDQTTLGKIQTLAPQVAPSIAPTLQQVQAPK